MLHNSINFLKSSKTLITKKNIDHTNKLFLIEKINGYHRVTNPKVPITKI
jgi:hypothetical protein